MVQWEDAGISSYAHKLARSLEHKVPSITYEDIVQEFAVGFCEVRDFWDPSKGIQSFSYLFYNKMKWCAMNLIRDQDRRKRVWKDVTETMMRHFQQFASNVDALVRITNPESDGTASDTFQEVVDRDLAAMLLVALSGLPERERTVIRQRYGFNGSSQTLAEVGDYCGISRQAVGQIEARALEKLKYRLAKLDERETEEQVAVA